MLHTAENTFVALQFSVAGYYGTIWCSDEAEWMRFLIATDRYLIFSIYYRGKIIAIRGQVQGVQRSFLGPDEFEFRWAQYRISEDADISDDLKSKAILVSV